MSKVSRELFDELQVTKLSWRAFISAMLESISERLLMHKDDKQTALDHISEELGGLIHCQKLVALRTVLLLSRAGLMGVESQGLQASQTCCCKAAIFEALVNTANGADGSG
jgi:hypothetical protein